MSFGLTTWKADGTPIITPQSMGGVYVDLIKRNPGDGPMTKAYPDLTGLTLRVFQVFAGAFTWSTGVDGSNAPTITLTPNQPTYNDGPIYLIVFAA